MAVTKMWNVGNVTAILDYTVQDLKTDPNAIVLTDPETGETYTRADVMALRHITGWYSQAGERDALCSVLGYTVQPGKTEEKYVTAIHCAEETAALEMAQIKRLWGKTGGVQGVHAVQSFRPGEISPKLAHDIGVKLAEKLWGDRFQVVVSTHLDREHLHNHFVINSVSYRDGKKFYLNHAAYDQMRVTSDQLCRDWKLSVIDRPKRGRRPNPNAYAQAGIPHRQTNYLQVRQEIDEAIAHSESMEDFYSWMKAKGYTFRSGNVKYLSLTPPGAEKACRIEVWMMKKFGLDYSVAGIQRMILERTHHGGPVSPEAADTEAEKRIPPKGTLQRSALGAAGAGWARDGPKQIRFRGKFPRPAKPRLQRLYLYYCYLFGVFPQRRAKPQTSYRQVYKMRCLAEQTRFLISNKVDTLEQLAALQARIQAQIDTLVAKRKPLYQRPRHTAQIQSQIDEITSQLRLLRKQRKLCDEIRTRYDTELENARREQWIRQMLKQTPSGEVRKQQNQEECPYANGTGSGQHDRQPNSPVDDRRL